MRTAADMFELGYGPALIQDANGQVVQHLVAGDFTAWDYGRKRWAPFHREDAWWDLRMTRKINPATVQFPVHIVWEETRA